MYLFILQTGIAAPIATVLLTALAGFIAPFLTQYLKDKAETSGRTALLLAVGVSVVLSVGAALLTQEIKSLADLVGLAPWVFSESTILFKMWKP